MNVENMQRASLPVEKTSNASQTANRNKIIAQTVSNNLNHTNTKSVDMDNKIEKKVNGQKNVAILLIIVPMIILISYLGKSDFEKYGINNYVICGALIVLMICGGIGLKNSLNKHRELRK